MLNIRNYFSIFFLGLLALLAVACGPANGPPAVEENGGAAVAEGLLEQAEQTAEPAVDSPATAVPQEVEPTAAAEPLVEPRPDDRSNRLQSITSSWNTNWELRLIDTDELLSGGPPRDGIPSIDNPQFISFDEANDWLADNEPVVSLEIDGDARAYPLQILTWHEIVNDTVGGEPVLVTFCPLCNAAIVFERTIDGEAVEFGTSGLLRNSDLVMYDRATESLWQQFTGQALIGDLAGRQLDFLPAPLISYANFKDAFPDGVILSRETGFNRAYGTNPYAGYDTYQHPLSFDGDLVLFQGELDGRLLPAARVVAVSLPDAGLDVAYPLEILAAQGVIHDAPGGVELAVFHLPGTSSALDSSQIAEGRDVGATAVFSPLVDGRKLTFTRDGEAFVDEETGSRWNIVGRAVDGELAGAQLTPVVSADHFWFSWAAFRPETVIYDGS